MVFCFLPVEITKTIVFKTKIQQGAEGLKNGKALMSGKSQVSCC